MRSFRINKVSQRRATFLNLVSQVGSQLREAYGRRYEQGVLNQSTLAKQLDVDRSAINRRLLGSTNLTLKTLADLVWSLGYAIRVIIYDPRMDPTCNHFFLRNGDTSAVPPLNTIPVPSQGGKPNSLLANPVLQNA